MAPGALNGSIASTENPLPDQQVPESARASVTRHERAGGARSPTDATAVEPTEGGS